MIAKLAAAGFSASRAASNIGHNPWRMTFVARHALPAQLSSERALRLLTLKRGKVWFTAP